jgi:hypothetical protein
VVGDQLEDLARSNSQIAAALGAVNAPPALVKTA